MTCLQKKVFAWVFGILTHTVFACSVLVMIAGLYTGLRIGHGSLHGWMACAANALLILQFPLLHSYFLGKSGRRVMSGLMPGGMGVELCSTTFALIGSLQLLVTFELWSPSGVTIYQALGWKYWGLLATYFASWLFLVVALTNAGLGLQTGYAGWSSVVRGKKPEYGAFPTHGLFRVCRHPVYLGFALVMWTAPTMTLDSCLLAGIWSLYCAAGPKLKEARYRGWYGEPYVRYCERVPYILPRIPSGKNRAA